MSWSLLTFGPDEMSDAKYQLKAKHDNFLCRWSACQFSKSIFQATSTRIYYRGFQNIKKEDGKRLLLISNHRSVVDPMVNQFLFIINNVPAPKTATLLSPLSYGPLGWYYARNGSVFIKGSFRDPVYREQTNEQFRKLADEGNPIQFFIEGKRSTSGKQVMSRRGLLNGLSDKDSVIYPITLSFERVPEDSVFVKGVEGICQLGQFGKQVVNKEKFGNIYAHVSEPIYLEGNGDVKAVALKLGQEMTRRTVVFRTDVVSTLLLHNPNYTLRELETESTWMLNAIRKRGVDVHDSTSLTDTLELLKDGVSVSGDKVTITEEGILIFYRNRILHLISNLPHRLMRYEYLWVPNVPFSPVDATKIRNIGDKAIKPTIDIYRHYLSNLPTSVSTLKEKIPGNKHWCEEHPTNLLTALQEDKHIKIEEDKIILLRKWTFI